MADSTISRQPWKTIGYGTLLAAIMFGLLFWAMNAPQCPEGYTQEQIEASNCIVGANIGIGLLVACIPLLWVVCVYAVSLVMGKTAGSGNKK